MHFTPKKPSARPARKAVLAAALAVAGIASATAATAATPVPASSTAHSAARATAHTASGNPLHGYFGIYSSNTDDNPAYEAYLHSSGSRRTLLARVARRSRVQWFGAWQSTDRIKALVHNYIASINASHRGAISLLTAFGIPRWESARPSRNWSSADVVAYHRWVDAFAAGIGSSRVALVLQPDLLYVLSDDHPAVPLGMVRYAAKKFGSLPHTTVYLDAGASDWRPSPKQPSLVSILRSAGIQFTRGFALNDTHHDSITNELLYGAKVAKALSAARLPNHFVVNTADNGRPFLQSQLNSNNDPRECTNATMHPCVTLGIPGTWDVTNPRWKLGPGARGAAKNADGYVWMGRPWIINQNKGGQFSLTRTLNMARTTPFK